MTETREVVYRMRDRDAAQKLYAEYKTQSTTWLEDLKAFFAEVGLDGKPYIDSGLGGGRVVGAERMDPIPAGWKVKGKNDPDVIVPDKRRKAGREAAARLNDLRQPDPRRDLPGGMPFFCIGGRGFLTCGLREMDGTLWVDWSGEPSDADKIDPDVWERVPLSVYYAALEQDEVGERAS